MAGRITIIKDGIHPSVTGSIIEPVTLSYIDRKRIDSILGCELTDADVEMLCSGLELVLHLQHVNDDSPTSQDAKETLKAILREVDNDKVLMAYDGGNGPDSKTSELLVKQLYDMEVKSFDQVSAEQIRKAARAILAKPQTAKNGRPQEIWRPQFARFARNAWAKLGRADNKAYIDGASEEESPFLSFALVLSKAITPCDDAALKADAVIKILNPRKAIKR